MARTHAECERMLEAFDKAGVPLFVAYYRRALDRFVKAKQIVDSGALGRIVGVSCRFASGANHWLDPAQLPWRVVAEHAGAGFFLDLASHTLDILDFLFGPLEDVTGRAARLASPGDVEDRVLLTFCTPGGALGSGSWSFSSQVSEDIIAVSGSEGELRLSTFGKEPVELSTKHGTESFDLPNPQHIQQPLIQSVVLALLGDGSCPSTGESAARTSRVMDQALLSYYGTRADGFWLHPERWPGRNA
jgi:predicted dehydrogenase